MALTMRAFTVTVVCLGVRYEYMHVSRCWWDCFASAVEAFPQADAVFIKPFEIQP